MKGYKGFKKGLICRGKQYAENTVFEEDAAKICDSGMHFCALPHQVFEHYGPGYWNEFAEVEALEEVFTDDNRKYCTKKLRIGRKINVSDICKNSVSTFFDWFGFLDKINSSDTNIAGDYGAANAGDYGAANAGDYGAANAGNYGAANVGNCGAANVGNCGAANVGNCGAANVGNYGAAIVRKGGCASAGAYGVAVAFGNGAMAKGKRGALLVLIDTDEKTSEIKAQRAVVVDGEKILEDTYYTIKNNRLTKVE